MNKELGVSIIIPNWNGRSLLEKNLPDVISASSNPENFIKEIIIVDDASTDDSVSFLEKLYHSQIRLVKHNQNRGFSSAVNTGVRTAKFDLICLLNTDVIPKKDFLLGVISHFKREMVFGVSLHEDGYGPSVGKFVDGFIQHSLGKESNDTQNTFWISGGSGVFRRSTWMKLGWLDEKLFSPFYWEDVDICYRALKRGYKLLWEPLAKVLHEHELTTKKLNRKKLQLIQERNQLLFIWKNLTSPNLFRKHLIGLLKRLIRHPGYIKIFFLALSKINTVLKLRNKERKECIISDEIIFSRFK